MGSQILEALTAFVQPGDRLFVGYLATAMLLAAFVTLRQSPGVGFWQRVAPREIYAHRSAKTDYRYFVSSRIIFVLVTAQLASLSTHIASRVGAWSSDLVVGAWVPPGWPATLFVTMVVLVSVDLSIYVAHRLQHKVPALWEFHKVHHSAEVMTPMTVYRMHPVDDLVVASTIVAVQGVSLGLAAWAVGSLSVWLLFGINIGTALFYVLGFNLRHSHVWLSYGSRVERYLVSPAMHQLHHSVDPVHYDANYGFIFSVWDRLGGSLLVPDGRVEVTFGLADGESADYATVGDLYLEPFRKLRSVGRAEELV